MRGKIYKLVCNITGDVYFGSTQATLSRRKSAHKSAYKNGMKYTTAFKIMSGGNYDIILVEELEINNIEQLRMQERYYIENFDCVNKTYPTRTRQEYVEANRDHILDVKKSYRENNKEFIIEINKKYRENNKEAIKARFEKNKQKYYETQKEKYNQNKEEILSKNRSYREKNKDKIMAKNKEIIVCECGHSISRNNLSSHKKSQKHINSLLKK
jgi:hypothetical protein